MNGFIETLMRLWDWINTVVTGVSEAMGYFFLQFEAITELYTLAVRWVFPVLAAVIVVRCLLPLLQYRKGRAVWGYLYMMGGNTIPLHHWENSIGRSRLSDIVVNMPFISRSHAVLTFWDGTWTVTDLKSKNGVEVNGTRIEKPETVKHGDVISLGGLEMTLVLPEEEPALKLKKSSTEKHVSLGRSFKPGTTFLLIVLFGVLGGLQLCFSMGADINPLVPLTFTLFLFALSMHYLVIRWHVRRHVELELLCYFLCGLSLFIVASSEPDSLLKQFLAILIGLASFTALEAIMRDLGRARKLKYILVAAALVLLLLNLAIGETRFGATRWIDLGFITMQPSEFVKIAFVLAGTATLDRLLTTRNMTAFIGFSAACITALVLTRDFGSVAVFFAAFIVIAFMRSGDMRTIAFTTAGAVLGAMAVVSFMPYIATRFATWGNVWEHAYTTGYQQARTMVAAASGGLLGLGGGNGYLADVVAADTDLVFGILCEEWGLLVAAIAVLCIVFFGFYAVFLVGNCRSSFYAIAACGAASIFLAQTALNVLGSVDILPFTGVTIPFISKGGSSMIASWALLALIKSADERKTPYKRKKPRKKGD